MYKDILPFIEIGVYRLYSKLEDEGLFYDNEDQKYFGVTPIDTAEMLYDMGLEIDNANLMTDLIHSFGDGPWCDKDPYADNEQVELNYNWKEFKKVVKHKSR